MGMLISKYQERKERIAHEATCRRLFAFGFDETIIAGDSVNALTKILEEKVGEGVIISDETSTTFCGYLQKLVDKVTAEGVSLRTVLHAFCHRPYVDGMKALLQKVTEATEFTNSHFIVISDSFDYLIKEYLEHSTIKPAQVIAHHAVVCENPLQPVFMTLEFSPHHKDDKCKRCQRHFCKGLALHNYIVENGPFAQISYVGEGTNDICSALHLGESDLLFVREGGQLQKFLDAHHGRNISLTEPGQDLTTLDAAATATTNEETPEDGPTKVVARVITFKNAKTIRKELGLC